MPKLTRKGGHGKKDLNDGKLLVRASFRLLLERVAGGFGHRLRGAFCMAKPFYVKLLDFIRTSKQLLGIQSIFTLFVFLLIAVQIFLSSTLIRKGDVYYNEDIARDLLLIENTITNQPITLIGPRTLGITGFFHGPLWLYVNLPAYLIGHGNPLAMGVFWIFLYVAYLGIVYYSAKKLFDSTVALFSVLLLSSVSYTYIFNNTFGALMLFPLYFYFFTHYLKTAKVKFLAIAFFIIGLIIQFELAFGIPILIVSLPYLFYFLIRKKKLKHHLSLSVILIPLSTYILFDLRHNFIQIHSLLNYIFPQKASTAPFISLPLLQQRLQVITGSSLQFLNHHSTLLNIIFFGLGIYLINAIKKKNNLHYAHIFITFLILYIGFWIVTLIFKGGMWLWYYYEFTPVIVILFCSSYRLINRYIFIAIFLVFYIVGMQGIISDYAVNKDNFIGKDRYSWQLYSIVARKVYTDAPKQFSYYVYEGDELGYRTRYAMHYFQKDYNKIGSENTKQKTTYLLINSVVDNNNNNWWKENKVRINKKPIYKNILNNIYLIEKYELNANEIAVPSDPSLIDNLFFR